MPSLDVDPLVMMHSLLFGLTKLDVGNDPLGLFTGLFQHEANWEVLVLVLRPAHKLVLCLGAVAEATAAQSW